MKCDARVKIDKILENINSIYDLDSEKILELRATSVDRFSIQKFPVEFCDWVAWSEKHQGIRGVEYNAQNSCIRIKATNNPLHGAATGVIREWLHGIRDSLSRATGNEFDCIGTTGSYLGGEFDGSEKAPDEGLCQGAQQFPLIAVEVAVSKRTTKVFDDVKQWLQGSEGCTKLVIVVDIIEKSGNCTETTDWGLSKDELGQLDVPDLAEHILQWQKDNNVALIGRFEAFFYLCFYNQKPQKVWKCDFSLDRLKPECLMLEKELGHVMANDLVPGLDGLCFPLPFQELSTKMRRSLSRFEFKRASIKTKEKWKEMKKISDQERITT
ncbi:predicted protein [Uncinocarpus reesii 1704]|uniref:Uncharacterized protein n=1 Tax=Uncinocarpus reesii (strain UAMH 1704) TaxID=336963 RepID=C4JED6_UNCRE|nr:uncharacterized protein UREG_00775 [Uncinocarpus reesii 1704]EEP75928.1 predicted protein [Uncinocarpus reesii 1704]